MTPAQEAKAEVYRELGYRIAGMVGVDHRCPAYGQGPGAQRPGHRAGRQDYEDLDSVSKVTRWTTQYFSRISLILSVKVSPPFEHKCMPPVGRRSIGHA